MIEDAVKAGAAEGAHAGVLAALRSPEGKALIAAIVREAVGEVAPKDLRIAEFSERSGIPPSTVRHYIKTGRLRARKIGRSVLIPAEQLCAISEDEVAARAEARSR